ncbi:DUF6087 family protein [Streptomyces sp. NPDC003077]|uniref:DUF6087 family protein n=1 Tax=Streptomyces sp. NPDC003077 TaxID=3154443 RepID=UPI0033AF8939
MDEPLADWARRRQERRERHIGRLRAIPLAPGARGAHVHPQAPRMIVEWTGEQWTPVQVVADLAAAREVLDAPRRPVPRPSDSETRLDDGPGPGRHRRPAV